MAEQDSKEQYIKCSRCKCKYINDDEHIKTDFGYTMLNELNKTCSRCRGKCKVYNQDNTEKIKQQAHKYWIDNKDEIMKKRQQLQKYADENNGEIKYCYRCYKNKTLDAFVCPNGKSYNACYACLKSRYG